LGTPPPSRPQPRALEEHRRRSSAHSASPSAARSARSSSAAPGRSTAAAGAEAGHGDDLLARTLRGGLGQPHGVRPHGAVRARGGDGEMLCVEAEVAVAAAGAGRAGPG